MMVTKREDMLKGLLNIGTIISEASKKAMKNYEDENLSDEDCFRRGHDDLEKISDSVLGLLSHTDARLYLIYRHIAEDINAIIDSYNINVNLTENEYDIVINEILDMDYSDYNDYIKEKIDNVLSERRK